MHCFDIIPLDGSGSRKRRRFAAPAHQRNEWIYAINKALATYQCMKGDRRRGLQRAAEESLRNRMDTEQTSCVTGVASGDGNWWTEGSFL